MSYSKVNLISWTRFITRSFAVVPELLGLACEFPFEKAQVRIELPSKDNLDNNSEDSNIALISYKEENGRKIPLQVAVDSVDVLVNLNESIPIPEKVLTRPPNAIDLLTEKQQQKLNDLADEYGNIASRAFEQWIRVLRWKSRNGSIGRPEIRGARSGWSTYFINDRTKRRFWAGPNRLTLRSYGVLTLTEWNEVEQALKIGQTPPVYIELMFDGIEHFILNDLQRSVVDLAVACEAFMRARVMQNLPKDLTKAILEYIDEASIRRVMEDFFKDTLNEDQKKHLKRIKSRLHRLFNARNTILHSGQKEDLTSADCKEYIEATKELIANG